VKFIAILLFVWRCNSIKGISANEDGNELLLLEKEWFNLEFRGDSTRLSKLLHPDFICITPDKNLNKQETLLQVMSNYNFRQRNGIGIDSFKLEQPVVKVYRDVAVVTFVEHFYGNKNGLNLEGTELFYDVWLRVGKKWVALSSQKHY
jgi:hypothetical protein